MTPLVCLIMKAIDSVVAFSAACVSAKSGLRPYASMDANEHEPCRRIGLRGGT